MTSYGKKPKGQAVETFYKLVTTMNPALCADKRVSVAMVSDFLQLFEKEVGKKTLINYDLLLENLSEKLKLPEALIEPFLEMYASAYFAMTNRKFIRLCRSCGTAHNLEDIQQCGVRDSAVVKTAIGIVLVDDSEDLSQVKN